MVLLTNKGIKIKMSLLQHEEILSALEETQPILQVL